MLLDLVLLRAAAAATVAPSSLDNGCRPLVDDRRDLLLRTELAREDAVEASDLLDLWLLTEPPTDRSSKDLVLGRRDLGDDFGPLEASSGLDVNKPGKPKAR